MNTVGPRFETRAEIRSYRGAAAGPGDGGFAAVQTKHISFCFLKYFLWFQKATVFLITFLKNIFQPQRINSV